MLGAGEATKLERRLTKELTTTFRELQAMVQICMQQARGEDPNISNLLGIKCKCTLHHGVRVTTLNMLCVFVIVLKHIDEA